MGGKVLAMKDFHHLLLKNTKKENFLVWVDVYLMCRESDELPSL
jgi:hypothetical protein